MIDRNTASNFLLGMLANYITHHAIALVTLLAAWLTPKARRGIDWLLRRRREVTFTPPSGSITLSGARPQLPTMRAPIRYDSYAPQPQWLQWEGIQRQSKFAQFSDLQIRQVAKHHVGQVAKTWGTSAATE